MKKNGLKKFMAGALIGASLGVLFAPKKGSETRADLKNKLDDLMDKVKDIDLEDVKEAFTSKIEEIKSDLKDLDKEKAINFVKQKSVAIMSKVDDLVDMAVKKGTPVVEKAAKEVKAKTVVVLKDVTKRLEGNSTSETKKSTVKKASGTPEKKSK